MQKVIRFWDKTEEILIFILIGIASYLTFQEVVLRYVFNTGWGGSYEITTFALIWCTFIGASLGIKEGTVMSRLNRARQTVIEKMKG